MKTAISIPDELFESAEGFAQEHGLSRSELYVKALRKYLQEQEDERITERLNAFYATESNSLEPALMRAQLHGLTQDEW